VKNLVFSTFLVLAVFGFTAGTARAQSPHFIHTASVSGINSSGDVTVSWKEAGVGNNTFISYSFTANAIADYGCVNGGGKHPKATNKATVQGPVSSSGTFQSDKNGSISASLTLTPPALPSDFSCPSGQTLVLADITYADMELTDTTNNISADLSPTSVSAVFVKF
jgi:hypothetical protein